MNLTVRKVGDVLRVETQLGHLLCTVDKFDTRFYQPVTAGQLDRINAIAQDFEFLLSNIIEE